MGSIVGVVFIVVAVLAVGLALYVIGAYNRLVALRNLVEEAWAQIDVQLKRRHDLIPNLVNTVQGYAAHEESVLTAVTEARAAAVSAGAVGEQARAENMLTGALRSLFAVAESYPELKADANFRELQLELARTEDQIAGARQHYNASVRDYQTACEVFPTNIVAGAFNFASRPYFEVTDPDSREPVEVQF